MIIFAMALPLTGCGVVDAFKRGMEEAKAEASGSEDEDEEEKEEATGEAAEASEEEA